jgi:Amt family ammonium transporter
VAGYAAMNSELAASLTMTLWMCVDWYRFGKPKLVGMCVGAIAGLATVTPAAGFIEPWGAFIIGILATIVCYGCIEIKNKMGWDDALDVWAVHGMGGFTGTLMLGVLAVEDVNGSQGSGALFGTQLLAACIAAIYSMSVTIALLFGMSKVVRLKPNPEEVALGLDMAIHGEAAYKIDGDMSPKSKGQASYEIDESKPTTMI